MEEAPAPGEVTRLLHAWKRGDVGDRLIPIIYQDPAWQNSEQLFAVASAEPEEAARSLGVSIATANREWAVAKSWLYRRLKKKDG